MQNSKNCNQPSSVNEHVGKPPKKKKRIKSGKNKSGQSTEADHNNTMAGNQTDHPISYDGFSQFPSSQQFWPQQPPPPSQYYQASSMQYAQAPPKWASEMSLKIDQINKRLEKLDIIEASIIDIRKDMKNLGDRVKELEHSQQFFNKTWEDERKTNAGHKEAVNQELATIRESVKSVEGAKEKMENDIVDLQCRSMRDNLLFFNVKEGGSTEDCAKIVTDICNKIEVTDVNIERAHRLGKPGGGRTRPIVAKFSNFPKREEIRKNSYKLGESNCPVSIGEQFPKVVQERRKSLLPALKKAKSDGKKARLVIDKLYIEGELYRPTGHR